MNSSVSIGPQSGGAIRAVDVHAGDGARAQAEMQGLGAGIVRYEALAP